MEETSSPAASGGFWGGWPWGPLPPFRSPLMPPAKRSQGRMDRSPSFAPHLPKSLQGAPSLCPADNLSSALVSGQHYVAIVTL